MPYQRIYGPDGRHDHVLHVDDDERLLVNPGEQNVVRVRRDVPGIGTGAAYAAEDAVGDTFAIDVPESGILVDAVMVDTDDNEINTHVLVFDDEPNTDIADNAGYVLDATDFGKIAGVFTFDTFVPLSGDTLAVENNINMGFHAPRRKLWLQLVTAGTPNFAAGTGLTLILTFIEDRK